MYMQQWFSAVVEFLFHVLLPVHVPNLLSNSKDFAKSTSLIKNNKNLIDLCHNIYKGIGTC